MSNDVIQAVGVFFSYAVLAIFAQNAVFTRGLGVSRLVQLVGDERTSSGWFALLLCVTQVLVAPLAFYAGSFAAAQPNFAQLRPLVYLACVAVVSLFEFLVLWAARGRRHGGQLLRILPAAAVNSGVLGTVLVERTQSFTLEQSMGFGLGSGSAVCDNRNANALTGTGRKRNRTTNRLVGFPGIHAELERNFGSLIKFHTRKFLEKSDRLRHAVTLLRIISLDLNLFPVKLTSTHRPPQFPCCARFLR